MPQKYCRKSEPPEQGARTLQTDRQTTDRRQMTDVRAIAYSEREREFTFANKNQLCTNILTLTVTLAMQNGKSLLGTIHISTAPSEIDSCIKNSSTMHNDGH